MSTQDEWVKKALASINGPLPSGIDREELQEAVDELKDSEPGDLTAESFNILDRTVAFQFGGKDHQSLSADAEQPEPAQAEPQDVEACEEKGENENVPQRLPEAIEAESERTEGPEAARESVEASQHIETVSNENLPQQPEASTGESDHAPAPTASLEEKPELPPGHKVNAVGVPIPQHSKEELKERLDDLKGKIKTQKSLARELKKNLSKLKPEAKASCEAKIAAINAEVEQLEKDRELIEHEWRNAPVDDGADEGQPWFGRVYANCRNFYVKMDDDTYKELSVEAASGFLKEWGISSRPDTQTTSPLDRAKNAIHNRHSVDWALALAGYQPGIIHLHGGKKVLITRGPSLLKPVPGEYPIITSFLDGLLRPPQSPPQSPSEDQVVYFKGWAQQAVSHLYAGRIKKGQSIVFAGPIDSGKSALQNLIITPLLGGRVARPYAFIVGRTDFNEEWFESEHLMLEDETPPRDYETQQRVAAGLKSLSANDDHWCHGKQKKAVTLPPYWRVSLSVNDTPEALRVVPVNDPTLKDKMIVLKVYPDAVKELVESLGGQDKFAEAIKAELPHILYDLLNVFKIPGELKDTRYGMKAYQNHEIVEAVEETAPYVLLLEFMRMKVYPGVKNLFKTSLEILQDLEKERAPQGISPKNPNTLGKYLTNISDMKTGEVVWKKTKHANGYVLNFPNAGWDGVKRTEDGNGMSFKKDN
jgi:hypothetical protein